MKNVDLSKIALPNNKKELKKSKFKIKSATTLNFSAGVDSETIKKLAKNNEVEWDGFYLKDSEGKIWALVTHKGNSGYVSEDLLQ